MSLGRGLAVPMLLSRWQKQGWLWGERVWVHTHARPASRQVPGHPEQQCGGQVCPAWVGAALLGKLVRTGGSPQCLALLTESRKPLCLDYRSLGVWEKGRGLVSKGVGRAQGPLAHP